MYDNFTQIYLRKNYSAHLAKITQDAEKLQLFTAVPYLELSKNIAKNNEEISTLNKEIKEARDKLRVLDFKKYELERAKHNMQNMYDNRTLTINPEELSTEDTSYVMGCITTGCNGYITKKYKCTSCDIRVCAQCHKLREGNGDEHTCDPTEVESVKLIKRDSKPCPKCYVNIYRVSGCNQMWCTVCHTTWNYNTGKIETGNVHNPHYYDYLRRNNRDAEAVNEVRCGEVPTYRQLDQLFVRKGIHKIAGKTSALHILEFLQFSIELNHMLLVNNSYRMNVNNIFTNVSFMTAAIYNNKLFDLRIKYLNNEMTELDWLNKIKSINNLYRRDNEYFQLYNTMYNISSDLYIKFVQDFGLENDTDKRKEIIEDMYLQIQNLITFINESVDKLCKVYNTSMVIKVYKTIDKYSKKDVYLLINAHPSDIVEEVEEVVELHVEAAPPRAPRAILRRAMVPAIIPAIAPAIIPAIIPDNDA
jgi:hypothetical protein